MAEDDLWNVVPAILKGAINKLTGFEVQQGDESPEEYHCKKHGPVTAFYPLVYQERRRGINMASGPFCMVCVIERQQQEYADCLVEPIKAGG